MIQAETYLKVADNTGLQRERIKRKRINKNNSYK